MKSDYKFIVIMLVLATIALAFFIPPFYAALLIPAVSVGAILLGNPRVFLHVYLWAMSIYPLLKSIAPSGPIMYLNELLGIILFAMFIVHVSLHRVERGITKGWGRIALFLMGYFFLSWAINLSPARPAVQCLFTYFSFIPFYVLSLRYLKQKDFRIVIRGTFILFWVNFALNIAWFLHINPLPNYDLMIGNKYDVAYGTFAGCNYVAYFCAMFAFLLISMIKSRNVFSRKRKVLIYLTFLAVLVQLYLTYTNHAYLFLIVAFIPYAVVSGIWKQVPALAAVGVVVLATFLALSFSEDVQYQFNTKNMLHRYDTLADSAKSQLFNELMVANRKENPSEWVFGVGPGNGMGSLGKDNRTPFALKMLLPYFASGGRDRHEMQMTSITGNTTSALFTLWGDFGLIGFVLYCSLYVWLISQVMRNLIRKRKGKAGVIAEFMIGALAMFIITNIAIDLIAFVFFNCWIWMLVALMNLPEEQQAESCEDDDGDAVSTLHSKTEVGL